MHYKETRYMADDKSFLTYNQQMKKLRKDKGINCNGTSHKTSLVRSGYFNVINGYKMPFTCGTNDSGNHTYIPNTSLTQINTLKKFDESLRIFLLKVEEEVRTLTGYKFDQCNDNGKIPWYETSAYSSDATLQSKMNTISSAYSELSKSKSEYVNFYMNNHEQLPRAYSRCTEKNIFDILIYFKYFLPKGEFTQMITEIKNMLTELQSALHPNAFANVRGQMGIRDLSILDTLISLPKAKIEYHKFDTL